MCWRCAQYPWFRHRRNRNQNKDSPVTFSCAWLHQQQTKPQLPPAPTLLLLLTEVLRAIFAVIGAVSGALQTCSPSLCCLDSYTYFFFMTALTDHKVQNKKCKSQRQSLLAGDAAVEQTCRGNETNPVRAPLGRNEKRFPSQAGWCSQHHHPFTYKETEILTIKKTRTRDIPILLSLTFVFSHERHLWIKLLW